MIDKPQGNIRPNPTKANETASESSYTMGYDEDFLQLLSRRSIHTHCGYLLSNLKAGMTALDLGCGPGNIAVGLAEYIHPGILHGVDSEASQIDIAKTAAAAGNHDNATFEVGDALNLPFEDDRFDLVHCHAVVMHIPDTTALLAEIRRVLKPGGLFATRDMIGSASFMTPHFGTLDSAFRTFERLLTGNGGHPQMGKEIKSLLQDAGFVDIRASASFEVFSAPEDVTFWHKFVQEWYLSDHIVESAIQFGIATQEQFDVWRTSLDQWKNHPGAFGALAWGEAIASISQADSLHR